MAAVPVTMLLGTALDRVARCSAWNGSGCEALSTIASAAGSSAVEPELRPAPAWIELALGFLDLRGPPILGGASERADGTVRSGSASTPWLMADKTSVAGAASEGCVEVKVEVEAVG